MKHSKRFLLALLLLCLPLALCYSVSDDEIIAALTEIATEIEAASVEQAKISAELSTTQDAQRNISTQLENIQTEQLPDTIERVNSLKDLFDDYKKDAERDKAMMLGALGVTFLVALFALAVAL